MSKETKPQYYKTISLGSGMEGMFRDKSWQDAAQMKKTTISKMIREAVDKEVEAILKGAGK